MVDEREDLPNYEGDPKPEVAAINAVLRLVDLLAVEAVADSSDVLRRGAYMLPAFDGPFLAKMVVVEVHGRTGDTAKQPRYSVISFVNDLDDNGKPLQGDALGIIASPPEQGLYAHSYGTGFGDAPIESIIEQADKAVAWLNKVVGQLMPDDRTQAAIDAQG